jgi:outer membrane protein
MMGTMAGRMLATLALVPAIAAAQGAGAAARPISIDDAVKLAQKNQPTTVLARNSVRQSESAVRFSKMNFLPSLSLSYNARQNGGTQFIQGVPVPISGNLWSYTRGLNSSVTLFDGGTKWYAYKTSEANLDAADAGEISARYSVALSVKTQYYNVLAAREAEAAANRQLEQNVQQLKVASAKMAVGTATLADSLSAAIGVANARLAILNARNSLENANAGLTRLIASPFPVTAMESDTADVGRVELSEATLTQMVIEGPPVKQALANVSAAKAAETSASVPGYLPSVTLTGQYGQNPKGSPTFDWGGGATTVSNSLSFGVSYTVFDNYRRENSIVIARVAEDNAEANLRDARYFAQQNLTTFLNNYQTAQETIALQLVTIASATENLRVVTQQYNLGTKQLLDVLTAQASLDQARSNLIAARLNARVAKANIEALIGRDLK